MKRRSDDALLITKGEQEEKDKEDHISNLPDELLVSILSRLIAQGYLDEAARTSILSSRWRSLWRFSLKNIRFVFNVADPKLYYEDDGSLTVFKCKEFVGWVNRVLELHLGDSIDDFHLLFFFADTKRYSQDIDGWLNFALRKKVKRLSVDLEDNLFPYSLAPVVILEGCRGVNTSLVSLRLNEVQVTGESLEYLLSVFRSLEDLSVSCSSALKDLTVSGPSLKLKHLEICCCWALKRLHVHGVVNLISFDYNGLQDTCVTIQETPHFVKLSIFAEKNSIVKIFTQIPQLETLQLAFNSIGMMKCVPEFPQLRKLKQLELKLRPDIFNRSLCPRLLEASPSLTDLKIRFHFLKESNKEKEVKRLEYPHQHLKVVELHGFIGCQLDIGVALYIIENTQSLEKMIVDPYSQDWNDKPEKGEAARTFARQHLGPRLPFGTELVVR